MLVKASLKKLRVSPTKANQVVRMVRGMNALKSLDALKFCEKRIARDIRKLILSAISNAENNFGLDIDLLDVKEIYVGRAMALKRMSCRAKGRGNIIRKPFSNIYVVLQSNEGEK